MIVVQGKPPGVPEYFETEADADTRAQERAATDGVTAVVLESVRAWRAPRAVQPVVIR